MQEGRRTQCSPHLLHLEHLQVFATERVGRFLGTMIGSRLALLRTKTASSELAFGESSLVLPVSDPLSFLLSCLTNCLAKNTPVLGYLPKPALLSLITRRSRLGSCFRQHQRQHHHYVHYHYHYHYPPRSSTHHTPYTKSPTHHHPLAIPQPAKHQRHGQPRRHSINDQQSGPHGWSSAA